MIRLLVMPYSISTLVMPDYRASPPADPETESATTVSETDRQSLGRKNCLTVGKRKIWVNTEGALGGRRGGDGEGEYIEIGSFALIV